MTSKGTGGHCYGLNILKNQKEITHIKMVLNKITNVSEVPFENPNYNQINSIGRQWIFEYTLAIAKEMLGYIRGKYSTIPIPDAECNFKPIRFIIFSNS
jgi:hypothetical protein